MFVTYTLNDCRQEQRFFSLLATASRPALGPTQSRNQWVTGALSQGVKRLGRVSDHSSPSSVEVKNAWSYISTPPYAFMAWCLVSTGHFLMTRYLVKRGKKR
jgi:hypothetical protein